MHCKNVKENLGSGASNKIKTKPVCVLEADESTWLRTGNSLSNHHEDHLAGKGDNSLQHYNLVHKFISMPQAMKIPAAKAAVDKEWEKLEKISAWNLTKVRGKKEVIDEARTAGAKIHFASPMDIRHLNAELVAKLFLILVELARFPVAFFIWISPWWWTQHWLIGETWWTVIGPIIRGMILNINLMQNHSEIR